MGFDLFVQRFRNGDSSPYPREIAEKILLRGAEEATINGDVRYLDSFAEIFCDNDGEEYTGSMIAHFWGRTILERVVEIANVTESLIYWPSTKIYLAVTHARVIEHLPEKLKHERSKLAIVRNVQELVAAIET